MADRNDSDLFEELRRLLGDRLQHRPEDLRVYECDAATMYKALPLAVVYPESTEDVASVVRICSRHAVPIVPRGAGTGLSGGATPVERCVIIVTSRMRDLLHVDLNNRYAVVQCGMINLQLTSAVAGDGYYYAPDPSSQMACTIGGNVAENSGGPHCLKHGMTTRHILGLRVVLPDGEIVELGGPQPESPGHELVGAFVGSEGTLGIATEITVRLQPQPEAVATYLASYRTMNEACSTVAALIAAGVDPSALEILDHLTIEAVESSVYAAGYPRQAAAVLLIELDGLQGEVELAGKDAESICAQHNAIEIERATTAEERKRLWKGRKGAFGAMGRVSTDLLVMDGTVPRHKLQWILQEIYRIRDTYKVTLSNVFHAGDGNLHPNISYDGRNEEERQRVLRAGEEILWRCIEAGGSLTGEHGIGVEKRDMMPFQYSDADLDRMQQFRAVWNPTGLCNPGKLLPTAKACVEARGRMLTFEDGRPPSGEAAS